MKTRYLLIPLIVGAAGLYWLVSRPIGVVGDERGGTMRRASMGSAANTGSRRIEDGSNIAVPRPLPYPTVKTRDPVMETTSQLNSPDTHVEDDLGIVEVLLESYLRSMGAVPAGLNDQVMTALQGENARGLMVFPLKHPALSASGELLDRWGTPYWFHAMSSKTINVISAGPDKAFGTPDDIPPSEGVQPDQAGN